ncbi:MAG TPA: MEDS domain-containing protein [Edaphobacter sp.]|nr:MEDS domain-containing protein [Edaphobacter sp.]
MKLNIKKSTTPISLAGSHIDDCRHVCAFFTSEEEEYRVLMPFIREGFSCGDKAVHVVDPSQREEHLQRLATVGIDTSEAQASGQLEILNNTEAYLKDGRFDQDRMLEAFKRMASGNSKDDFPLSRIVCRMDWAVGDQFRIQNVIEFEARVNHIWSQHDDAVICTYHLAKFGGDVVVDILRTHPMVIIGGILQRNPFYIPPDEFLYEYRQRQQNGATR